MVLKNDIMQAQHLLAVERFHYSEYRKAAAAKDELVAPVP